MFFRCTSGSRVILTKQGDSEVEVDKLVALDGVAWTCSGCNAATSVREGSIFGRAPSDTSRYTKIRLVYKMELCLFSCRRLKWLPPDYLSILYLFIVPGTACAGSCALSFVGATTPVSASASKPREPTWTKYSSGTTFAGLTSDHRSAEPHHQLTSQINVISTRLQHQRLLDTTRYSKEPKSGKVFQQPFPPN